MSALPCAGLVVGDEVATARPRPVVGGAEIGAGHSAHAGIAELAWSAMSVRPRCNRPARVRARPLTFAVRVQLAGERPHVLDEPGRVLPPCVAAPFSGEFTLCRLLKDQLTS